MTWIQNWEELLRESPKPWTPPTQPPPPDYPNLPGVVRTADQLEYAAGRVKKILRDALQKIVKDMLPCLKDYISSSEASTPRTPSQDVALEDLSDPEEAAPNNPNLELLNEESESRYPELVSEELQGMNEAVQKPHNLEHLQVTPQYWESYEEQLNENPAPGKLIFQIQDKMEIYMKERV